MTETQKKTLIEIIPQLIFRRVRDNQWLYWPPGPMTGQVFDMERCKKDISQLIEEIAKKE